MWNMRARLAFFDLLRVIERVHVFVLQFYPIILRRCPQYLRYGKINAQILYKAHFWCRRLDIKHPTKNLMYHSFLLKKKGKLHHLSVSFQANFELFLKGFGATNWFKSMQRELRRSYDRN